LHRWLRDYMAKQRNPSHISQSATKYTKWTYNGEAEFVCWASWSTPLTPETYNMPLSSPVKFETTGGVLHETYY
jgi:hypothetical protein